MAGDGDFYIVTVEENIVQIISYVVKAPEGPEQAVALVNSGSFVTESVPEKVDTIYKKIAYTENLREAHCENRND